MTAEVAPLREGDPERLGSYRLTGLLGEGGQGAVYLGEDEPGHRVAVKLLHARFSGDPKARARFAAEVATTKRVSAFCTARVLDSDVEGDRPYIVSEYIEGPSLSDVLLSEGPRRGADLDRLAIGTMTALAAIHQAGVVHRDFKPANVLLAPDGPRVIDFGIARALDATGTMSSATVGTPAYMAPEQISGAQVGPAADVFAWGTTMVYAATGRPAFGQDSIPAVMHRILNLPPDLGDLAEPLRQVVADCLSKDPALRPASEQVLAHLLSLAGTLPQPEARQDARDEAAILTQGAATAATATTQLRAQAAPPSLLKSPPQPGTPQPGTPQPGTPVPGTPQPSFAPPPPTPGPPPPGGRTPGTPPWQGGPAPGTAPWPSGPTVPAGSTGKNDGPPRRPGIAMLASVGGAALVALVLVGTVVIVQLNRENGNPSSPQGRTGGTFRMAALAPNTAKEIDPANAAYGTGAFIARQLFTGLTEVDAKGVVHNRLATDIASDPSCRRWKINIRQGTTFSDGSRVDAAAFARGWTRAARSKVGTAPYLMANIEGFLDVQKSDDKELSGVKVIDDHLLEVSLTSPNCEFPASLAEPAFMPVHASAGRSDDETYNLRPIGNGPFVVQDYAPNRQITLERNRSWAFGKPRLRRVEITLASDLAVARSLFAAERVDWSELPTDGTSPPPESDLVTGTALATRLLVPLTQRGPMKSLKAREAVALALDRKQLSTLLGGVHKPAQSIVPPSIPGFGAPGSCALCGEPDPERAKKAAEAAGLRPGTTVRLYVRERPANVRLAESMRQQLASTLGWQIELKVIPFTEFYDAVTANDASGLALHAYGPDYAGAYPTLWPLLAGKNATGKGSARTNLSGWKNAEFDDLLSTASRTSAAEQRTRLFKRAEQLALDHLALIPLLYEGKAAMADSDKFVGLGTDLYGYPTVTTAALK